MRITESNASEPWMTCRKPKMMVKTGVGRQLRDKVDGNLFYWSIGLRHIRGETVIQASVRNVRTCRGAAKGAYQAGSTRKVLSTNALHTGGSSRSSIEAPGIVGHSHHKEELGSSLCFL